MTTEFNESEALRYPLFADDFGEQGDKVLRDVIATARTQKTCHECLGPIEPGDRYRRHVGLYGGALSAYAFCPLCCLAMSVTFNGQYDAMEARFKARDERSGRI